MIYHISAPTKGWTYLKGMVDWERTSVMTLSRAEKSSHESHHESMPDNGTCMRSSSSRISAGP